MTMRLLLIMLSSTLMSACNGESADEKRAKRFEEARREIDSTISVADVGRKAVMPELPTLTNDDRKTLRARFQTRNDNVDTELQLLAFALDSDEKRQDLCKYAQARFKVGEKVEEEYAAPETSTIQRRANGVRSNAIEKEQVKRSADRTAAQLNAQMLGDLILPQFDAVVFKVRSTDLGIGTSFDQQVHQICTS